MAKRDTHCSDKCCGSDVKAEDCTCPPTCKHCNCNAKNVNEGLGELADMAERDHEVQMARAQLYKLAKYSIKLHDMLKGISEAEGIEGWQQAKITKASDYISSVYHSLDYEKNVDGKNQMNAMVLAQSAKESTDPYKARLHNRLSERKLTKGKGKKRYGKNAKKESLNREAKKILGEGQGYQVYLELSEAPIGDVVNKMKKVLSKLPKQAAKKATGIIKKIPKSAWPIAAGILFSMLGADPASAQDLSLNIDMDAFRAAMAELEQLQADLSDKAADFSQQHGDTVSQRTNPLGQGSSTNTTSNATGQSDLARQASRVGRGFADILTRNR
jgi:hypothetical protein